jgi:hypothetical protein
MEKVIFKWTLKNRLEFTELKRGKCCISKLREKPELGCGWAVGYSGWPEK